MFDSKKYWNERYVTGQSSGSGSYNELAQFKGDIINNFFEENEIKSIIDYGVGDGNQLKLINTKNRIYTGIDVSEFIIKKCKEYFKNDETKKFIHSYEINEDSKADVVLSCDVIFHLIEDDVYTEYMKNLFSMSNKYVIIYAKNEDVNHCQHVKFRKFSNYIESNLPEWQLIKHIPNKYPQLKLGQNNDKTSPSDFYIYILNKYMRNLPVYISITSIFQNQNILLETLKSIINQSKMPDKIFLYLSEEPYLLDEGFQNKKITDIQLLDFINNNQIISINWVKNTGSYRKLLPLLKDKWEEDCLIITIDDDTVYDSHLIQNLINDYYEQKCVVGYRGFTPSFDKVENFNYLKKKKEVQKLSLYNYLTGKGGILYKPEFFHKTQDLIFNHEIYLNFCHTADDIWFYIVRLLNNINCYIDDNKNWLTKDNTKSGLYVHFNNINNNNTVVFRNTIEKLKDLDLNNAKKVFI
jgi:hypothetical protein